VPFAAGDAVDGAWHAHTSVALIDDVITVSRPTAPVPLSTPAEVAAPAHVDSKDAARFQAALDAARATGSAYGVTFAAVHDGQLLWAGSSGRQRDGRTALEAGSPLVIGSVTKTFVAATVLQLVEEGQIRLDAPMRTYLPELSHISDEITIAQLLDHTSGLADVFNDTTRAGLEEHPEHAWTAEEVLGSLHAPWYPPGDGWAYANTNYYLLGLVVERVTGASLADELSQRFLDPLSLPSTRILDGTEAGGPLQPAWTSIFWASGAMSASAADLARWGDALYTGGILRPETRAGMLELNDDDYGFGVQKVEVGDTKGYGHTGLLNTYTTLLYHLPKEDVTVALLVNRSHVDLGAMLTARPGGGQSLLELALDD
jgi:D-alanyl-D-alanine carboxypeptidase